MGAKPSPMALNEPDGGSNRAAPRVAAAAMGDGVALSLVLLGCEIEADRRGGLYFVVRRSGDVQSPSSKMEPDVI